MKKILLSAGMIVFMGALLAGATGAFFSDSETSTGNTFTAGDIDLKIDNTSYVTNNDGELVASPNNTWTLDDLTDQLFFSFEDVKPGDIGEDTISIHPGTNDAYACMAADITATPDNGINEPEGDAGDVTDGDGGELQNYLNFTFWEDDGDNVYEVEEAVITELTGVASAIFDGEWLPIADSGNGPALPGGSTTYVGKAWCFGTLTPAAAAQDGNGSSTPLTRGTTGFTCDGSGENNMAQTDGITVDVSFYAVQARNNGEFLCSELPPFGGEEEPEENPNEINQADLATSTEGVGPTSWFFYNDTNDTIMPIDQFAGTDGQNHMESVAAEEGAKMVLDTGVNPRYNIATAQFGDVLSTISALNFRVYDATVDGDTPFIQFNVDFATTSMGVGYQGRLTMQPGTSSNDPLAAATWTTVDAINGGAAMWTWSRYNRGPDLILATPDDNSWPDGDLNQYRSWSSILAGMPDAKLLNPGSFLGVRTGQPGPAGATNFVSSINFDGTTYDFEI